MDDSGLKDQYDVIVVGTGRSPFVLPPPPMIDIDSFVLKVYLFHHRIDRVHLVWVRIMEIGAQLERGRPNILGYQQHFQC